MGQGVGSARVGVTEQEHQAMLSVSVPPDRPREHLARLTDLLRRAGGTEVAVDPGSLDHPVDMVFATVHVAVSAAAAVLRQSSPPSTGRPADHELADTTRLARVVVLTAAGEGSAEPLSGVTLSWAHRLLGRTDPGRVLTTSAAAVIASASLLPGLDLLYRGLWQPAASEEPDRIYELVDLAGRPSVASQTAHSNLGWARHAVHGSVEDRAAVGLADSIVSDWRASEPGAVMVTVLAGPPPGVDRCFAEAAIGLHAAGATILHGSCTDDAADRYGVFRESFGAYASGSDRRELIADLEGHAPELARLLPEVGSAVGGPHLTRPGHPDLARLCDCLETWLRSMAQRTPVVMFIDQAQWINNACTIVLSHLAHTLRSSPVRFVLAESRTTPVPSRRIHRLLEHLGPDLCVQVGHPGPNPLRSRRPR